MRIHFRNSSGTRNITNSGTITGTYRDHGPIMLYKNSGTTTMTNSGTLTSSGSSMVTGFAIHAITLAQAPSLTVARYRLLVLVQLGCNRIVQLLLIIVASFLQHQVRVRQLKPRVVITTLSTIKPGTSNHRNSGSRRWYRCNKCYCYRLGIESYCFRIGITVESEHSRDSQC